MLSWTVTCIASGSLLGALVCALSFEKFNKEMFLVLGAIVDGAAAAIAPYSSHVFVYFTFVALLSAGHGFVNSAGNSYALSIWSNPQYNQPFLQSLHAVWCIGAALGPVIMQPFLMPFEYTTASDTNSTTLSALDLLDEDYYEAFRVKFAYIIIGAIIAGLGLAALVIAKFTSDNWCSSPPKSRITSLSPKPKWDNLMLCLLLLPVFFVISTLEGILVNFTAPFGVQYLGWSAKDSALLVTVLLSAFFFSRVLVVPLSFILRPSVILVMNWIGMLVASIVLCFIQMNQVAVWVGVVLAGLSLATSFPTTIAWASEFMEITGRETAVFVVGMQMSSLVYPPVIGYIFESSREITMMYILLGLTVFQCFYCSALITWTIKRYSSTRNIPTFEVELKNVDETDGFINNMHKNSTEVVDVC
ncbi:hypothetical protein CAPTEDRAFT_199774 [Capitella teleta]|uniref:Major facilitator superfamily (MFS) profile domain-containing protein n=1 Tax=Capitella teleta TaxID=283909 RepID=R7TSY6_CAPTE|nr:hypothetical protein CAPTEDRAFT_199774 [Capitella teleta]|eukprot:ELT97003.1 hypothetical protein CAPTEDRAFT_199774 [Capitella teleta]